MLLKGFFAPMERNFLRKKPFSKKIVLARGIFLGNPLLAKNSSNKINFLEFKKNLLAKGIFFEKLIFYHKDFCLYLKEKRLFIYLL